MGDALPGGEHSVLRGKKASKRRDWEAVNSSGRLNPAGLRHRPLSQCLGIGQDSLTTGSYRIYKMSLRIADMAIGFFKQGRESDFCYGKEDSGPGSEQLLCQTQIRLWIGEPPTGVSRAWAKAASRPCLWAGTWVSQRSTLLAGKRVVARAGMEEEPTSCCLPLHICVQRVRRRENRGACPGEPEPSCLQRGRAEGEVVLRVQEPGIHEEDTPLESKGPGRHLFSPPQKE